MLFVTRTPSVLWQPKIKDILKIHTDQIWIIMDICCLDHSRIHELLKPPFHLFKAFFSNISTFIHIHLHTQELTFQVANGHITCLDLITFHLSRKQETTDKKTLWTLPILANTVSNDCLIRMSRGQQACLEEILFHVCGSSHRFPSKPTQRDWLESRDCVHFDWTEVLPGEAPWVQPVSANCSESHTTPC